MNNALFSWGTMAWYSIWIMQPSIRKSLLSLMLRMQIFYQSSAVLSRYPMDQSEISQNICTSEVISREAKPSVISLHECEYFRYLTMDHAISVLSYGLVTCSSFCFARRAQTPDNFGWHSQPDLENSRLCNETTTYPLLTIPLHTKYDECGFLYI